MHRDHAPYINAPRRRPTHRRRSENNPLSELASLAKPKPVSLPNHRSLPLSLISLSRLLPLISHYLLLLLCLCPARGEKRRDEGGDGGGLVGAGARGEVGRRAAAGAAGEDEGLRPGRRLRALGRSLARGPGAPRPGHRGKQQCAVVWPVPGPGFRFPRERFGFTWNFVSRFVLALELLLGCCFEFWLVMNSSSPARQGRA